MPVQKSSITTAPYGAAGRELTVFPGGQALDEQVGCPSDVQRHVFMHSSVHLEPGMQRGAVQNTTVGIIAGLVRTMATEQT